MTKRARRALANLIANLLHNDDDYSLTAAQAMLKAWSVLEERTITEEVAFALAGQQRPLRVGDTVKLLTDHPVSLGLIVGKAKDGDWRVERLNGAGQGYFRTDEVELTKEVK